jgi:hypothetical protein
VIFVLFSQELLVVIGNFDPHDLGTNRSRLYYLNSIL